MVEITEEESKILLQLLNRVPVTGYQEATVLMNLAQKLGIKFKGESQ